MDEKNGVMPGTKVVVTERCFTGELGWQNTWEDGMDYTIGEEGIVIAKLGFYGIKVIFRCHLPGTQRSFTYPYFALEVVK